MDILLLENSDAFRRILEGIFSEIPDAQPYATADAEEALTQLENNQYSFICVSMYLAQGDGIGFVRKVRKLEKYYYTPIFLITSDKSQKVYIEALSAGVTEVFLKQELDQLINFISRLASKHSKLSGRILYIEDSEPQRLATKKVLTEAGLDVDDFDNANLALMQFTKKDYDLILTDIVLEEGMTGSEFTNKIRRMEGSKGDVPILALTGFDNISRRIVLFNLGVTDYVIKPLVSEELVARIRHLLEEKYSLRRVAQSSSDESNLNKNASTAILKSSDKNSHNSLFHSQSDLESLLNNIPDVFYRTDMNGVVTLISPSIKGVLGYRPEEMHGKFLKDFYCTPGEREKIVKALINENGKASQVEAWLRHKDGTPVWISTNAYVRFDDNHEPMYVEGIARNITQRKELETKLEYFAKNDGLTGVLNRRAFLEEVEYQIDISHRYSWSFSLAMIDLDWFKNINDEYGHHAGDDALKYFADTCKHIFRKTDIIGRIGGEEFAVLMPETEIQSAKDMLIRLRNNLSQDPLAINGHNIDLTFSSGLVLLGKKDVSITSLLRRADELLYKAKEKGRNKIFLH
ncbi:MAG: diguanylate cyclase [Gammaproteobacteria bacterium]|nr:diguanylate cyclase [Gammaproteobacteria bacterium]